MSHELSVRHAAEARDAGLGRLRRLTGLAVGAALMLTGAFAGVAARSTSGHKVVAQPRKRRVSAFEASAPVLPPPQAPSATAPAAPAALPASAPAPVSPVVVSGGS